MSKNTENLNPVKKLEKLFSLIPIHELEQTAQQQIYEALALDFLIKLAVMPDCHTGYTLPIGGVALLDNVISPEYVGYDIGCGMCYIATKIKAKEFFKQESEKIKLFEHIYKTIPVGFNSRKNGYVYYDFQSASRDKELQKKVDNKLNVQLGTLGGGNHFIEIGENNKGYLTITVHSGSRNIGHSIASYYMKLSKKIDIDLPKGFFHLNSESGQQYLKDMNFALEYAIDNRKLMISEILLLLGYNEHEISILVHDHMINENHNHAEVKGTHVLHRKGATPAEKGQIGIIPGNMKTGVYVTEGLGNEKYLNSASHGAGRTMSRKKAKSTIDMKLFKNQMKGIVAKVDQSTIDEAPDAYKNVYEVIKKQNGIVINIIDHAKPLIKIKR
ncbi:MAG: RtcB family protein [Thermoplasmata archaeon]|nr:MAG: RtcB family protein [Thermoplasmata archaeon]